MALIMSKMSSRGQVAYAEAGNVVEQTIGAIRTVKPQNMIQIFQHNFVLDLQF